MIFLEKLRKDIPEFIDPQMYYFIDDLPLLMYLKKLIPIVKKSFMIF